MGDQEDHGETSGSSSIVTATVVQSSWSQSLALQPNGKVADNWKLWQENYNNYFLFLG